MVNLFSSHPLEISKALPYPSFDVLTNVNNHSVLPVWNSFFLFAKLLKRGEVGKFNPDSSGYAVEAKALVRVQTAFERIAGCPLLNICTVSFLIYISDYYNLIKNKNGKTFLVSKKWKIIYQLSPVVVSKKLAMYSWKHFISILQLLIYFNVYKLLIKSWLRLN